MITQCSRFRSPKYRSEPRAKIQSVLWHFVESRRESRDGMPKSRYREQKPEQKFGDDTHYRKLFAPVMDFGEVCLRPRLILVGSLAVIASERSPPGWSVTMILLVRMQILILVTKAVRLSTFRFHTKLILPLPDSFTKRIYVSWIVLCYCYALLFGAPALSRQLVDDRVLKQYVCSVPDLSLDSYYFWNSEAIRFDQIWCIRKSTNTRREHLLAYIFVNLVL